MQGNWKYIVTTLLVNVFVLPLVMQLVTALTAFLIPFVGYSLWVLTVAALVVFSIPFLLGMGLRNIIKSIENECLRYFILSLPIIYYALIWLVVVIAGNLSLTSSLLRLHYYFIVMYAWYESFCFIYGKFWGGTALALTVHVLFMAGYYFSERWANPFLVISVARVKIFFPVCAGVIFTGIVTAMRADNTAAVTLTFPNNEQLFSIALQTEADIKIENNWPRLDGEEASYTLYASAFYRLYRNVPDENDYLQRNEEQAFARLLSGESDLLISTERPEKLKALAREKGISLTITPVALDGVVVAARRKNPRHDMTLQQLHDAYAAEKQQDEELFCIMNYGATSSLKRWLDEHTQFTGKGSYTTQKNMAFARKSMQGAYYRDGCIAYFTHQYLHFSGELDYLNILTLNSVEFSPQNIRSGIYPLIMTLYIVTKEKPTAATQTLADWFLSPQGQRLVQDGGYVPLYPVQE